MVHCLFQGHEMESTSVSCCSVDLADYGSTSEDENQDCCDDKCNCYTTGSSFTQNANEFSVSTIILAHGDVSFLYKAPISEGHFRIPYHPPA